MLGWSQGPEGDKKKKTNTRLGCSCPSRVSPRKTWPPTWRCRSSTRLRRRWTFWRRSPRVPSIGSGSFRPEREIKKSVKSRQRCLDSRWQQKIRGDSRRLFSTFFFLVLRPKQILFFFFMADCGGEVVNLCLTSGMMSLSWQRLFPSAWLTRWASAFVSGQQEPELELGDLI